MQQHILGDNDIQLISQVMGVDVVPPDVETIFSQMKFAQDKRMPGQPLKLDTVIIVLALMNRLPAMNQAPIPQALEGVNWPAVPEGQQVKVCPDGHAWYDGTFVKYEGGKLHILQAGRKMICPPHIVQLSGANFDGRPKKKLKVVHDEPETAGVPVNLREKRAAEGRAQDPKHHPQAARMPVSEEVTYADPVDPFAPAADPDMPALSDNPWEMMEPNVSRVAVTVSTGAIEEATFMGLHDLPDRVWVEFDNDPDPSKPLREVKLSQCHPDFASMGAADDPSNPNPQLAVG